MARGFLVLPGTRIFEFRVTPVNVESGQPEKSKTMTMFRAPEYICEPDPNAPKKPRSRLRFFATTCGVWLSVLKSLCPNYSLFPDVTYKGNGTRPFVWSPVHRQQLKKVTLRNGEMVPSEVVEWFDMPITSAIDLERTHGRKAVSGGLGITEDGSPGTWRAYTRPASKVFRRLTSGAYQTPAFEAQPQEDVQEVVNGLLLRQAVLNAHHDGMLPEEDHLGRPLFVPEDFPDLGRACSLDPEVNPLLGRPVEWKARLVKFEDDEDAEITPISKVRRGGNVPQGGEQFDDIGRSVRFL